MNNLNNHAKYVHFSDTLYRYTSKKITKQIIIKVVTTLWFSLHDRHFRY